MSRIFILIIGILCSVISLAYFVWLYRTDFRFKIAKLGLVILGSAIFISIVLLPFKNYIFGDDSNIGQYYILVFSCVMGVVCGIFCLGLSCAKRRGALGKVCSKLIGVQHRRPAK